jgi:hypothetical protein
LALGTELEDAHAAVLRELAELEALTRAAAPDGARLAATRLRLSRASSRRVQLLDRAIVPALLDRLPASETRALTELRSALGAARSRSSAHVVRWTLEKAKQDWAGYCRASAEMRKAMRAQIEHERRILAPLLRQIGE